MFYRKQNALHHVLHKSAKSFGLTRPTPACKGCGNTTTTWDDKCHNTITQDDKSDNTFTRDDKRIATFFKLACTVNRTQDSSGTLPLTDYAVIDFATNTH